MNGSDKLIRLIVSISDFECADHIILENNESLNS